MFDLMWVENDCIYMIFVTFPEFWCFNWKFGIKQSRIGWKFAEQWLLQAKILGTVDDREPNFFENA